MADKRIYSSLIDGVFVEEREMRTEAPFHGVDTVGPLCVVGIVEILSGSFAVVRDGVETWFDRGVVGLFKAPFCLAESKAQAVASRQHVAFFEPDASFDVPESFAFAVDGAALPTTRKALLELGRRPRLCRLERCSKPSALARKAKALFDDTFAQDLSIDAVAGRLGTSNAALTASFKKSFALTPHQYRAQLRTTLSLVKLLRPGAKIVDVAHEVSYQDLSRFNKQFKRATGARPKDVRSGRIQR